MGGAGNSIVSSYTKQFPRHCRPLLTQLWKKGAEEATWERLAEVLDSLELGEVAGSVREKHCKQEDTPATSPTSKLVRRAV